MKISSLTILITALLCVFKVTGLLTISWWWCFCLLWLPLVLFLALIGLLVITFVVVVLIGLFVELFRTAK